MKKIINNNTTIYNSDITAEEYKQKIIELQKKVKEMWKNYYKLTKKSK